MGIDISTMDIKEILRLLPHRYPFFNNYIGTDIDGVVKLGRRINYGCGMYCHCMLRSYGKLMQKRP